MEIWKKTKTKNKLIHLIESHQVTIKRMQFNQLRRYKVTNSKVSMITFFKSNDVTTGKQLRDMILISSSEVRNEKQNISPVLNTLNSSIVPAPPN